MQFLKFPVKLVFCLLQMDASGMVHDESFADSTQDMEVRKTLLSPPSSRYQTPDPGDSSSMSSTAESQTGPIISESQLKTRYEAESPDELALVKAACSYGCKLLRRTADLIQIWLPGQWLEKTTLVEQQVVILVFNKVAFS